jgi:hypothetical protein
MPLKALSAIHKVLSSFEHYLFRSFNRLMKPLNYTCLSKADVTFVYHPYIDAMYLHHDVVAGAGSMLAPGQCHVLHFIYLDGLSLECCTTY